MRIQWNLHTFPYEVGGRPEIPKCIRNFKPLSLHQLAEKEVEHSEMETYQAQGDFTW